MSARRRSIPAALAVAAVAAVLAVAVGPLPLGGTASAAAASLEAPDPSAVTGGAGYPGDPEAESRLVEAEERRLIDIRTTIDGADADGITPTRPYRLATNPIPTLVLVARQSPYTLEELAEIAPRSVAPDADGAYLLAEHIVVGEGAVLRIGSREGGTLRMLSAEVFTSLVAIGGTIEIAGSSDASVEVTSWDPTANGTDTETTDGRAYVRILGGHADFSHTTFRDLGFWSGVTGGVSFTGTVLPEPWLAVAPSDAPPPPEPEAPVVTEGDPAADAGAEDSGGLDTLALDESAEGGYASALVQSVTITGGAFGLFVTNAERVEIRDSIIENSLVDGLVLHRDVTDSSVESTVARHNAQDGFNLTRATSSVIFSRLTATQNGRNGITVEGRPLVDGPSATGIAIAVYGNNEVRDSIATGNGRYGIEVIGGHAITIQGNEVSGNQMGIVVTSGATEVTIKDNEVVDSAEQGIAVRSAGLDTLITGNEVSGTRIAIYLRDAGGRVEDNEISGVSNHGITLIGETGSTAIVANAVSGSGPTAIDVLRTTGSAVRDNDTTEWRSTKPLLVVLRAMFQPLTVMWILIGLVLVISIPIAVRRAAAVRDPFADQAPLSSFTRGVVPRDEIPAALSMPTLSIPETAG